MNVFSSTMIFRLALLGGLWMALWGPAEAQTKDNSFSTYVAGPVYSMAQQADGKILVGGSFPAAGGSGQSNLARLLATGSADSTFLASVNGPVNCVALLPDGKILIGGSFGVVGGAKRTNLALLNEDGRILTPLLDCDGEVNAIAQRPDGNVLIGGSFTKVNGVPRPYAALVNPATGQVFSFSPGLNGPVSSIAVLPDGKFWLGGSFTNVSGTSGLAYLAPFSATGGPIAGTDLGLNGVVSAIVLQADGKLVIGGAFTTIKGNSYNHLARLLATGTEDGAFNPNLNGAVSTLSLQTDGKIFVGGTFTGIGASACKYAARLYATGVVDPDFNPNPNGEVTCLVLQADGKILIGGDYSIIGNTPTMRLCRYTNWPSPAQTLTAPGLTSVEWARPVIFPEVEQVFFELWTGSSWISLGQAERMTGGWKKTGLVLPASTWLRATGVAAGGKGSASSGRIRMISTYGSAIPDISIEQPVGTSLPYPMSAVSFGEQPWPPQPITKTLTIRNTGTGDLTGLSVALGGSHPEDFSVGPPGSTTVVPGGSTTVDITFLQTGGGSRAGRLTVSSSDADENVYTINLTGNGVYSDGAPFPAVDGGVEAVALQADGKILLGGYFQQVDGAARVGLARLLPDGNLDQDFAPHLDSPALGNCPVYAIAVQPDGKILLTGDFGSINGTARSCVARLNADGSLDGGFLADLSGGSYRIERLALQPDGKILIGGVFQNSGANIRRWLARLNSDGSVDPTFDPQLDGTVFSMAVQSDGKILIGGSFTTVGAETRSYLARLNADGSLDQDFNPGVASSVRCLLLQPDGKILVGGDFTKVAGSDRNHLARLLSTGALDLAFNPNANNSVETLALQSNGQILAGGNFTVVGGATRKLLVRLQPDGSVESAFNPLGISNAVDSVTLQNDGRILVGGSFSGIGGLGSRFVRLSNDTAAAQSLVVPDHTKVFLSSSGSAPELARVSFQSWNGSEWSALGEGVRVSGGWQLTGASLPVAGLIRSLGIAPTGSYNGSSSVLARTLSYDLTPPLSALENWRLQYFESAENSGNGGDLSDYDQDGVLNLMEYALGGNPTQRDAASILPFLDLSQAGGTGHLTLSFERIADPSLTYQVWASADLVNWGSVPIWSSTGSANEAGPVTVTDPVETGSTSKRFLKLKIVAP